MEETHPQVRPVSAGHWVAAIFVSLLMTGLFATPGFFFASVNPVLTYICGALAGALGFAVSAFFLYEPGRKWVVLAMIAMLFVVGPIFTGAAIYFPDRVMAVAMGLVPGIIFAIPITKWALKMTQHQGPSGS
ncbi:MAG: hypothetical protein R2688_07605 [Fimbriimonadaceae bacterium]